MNNPPNKSITARNTFDILNLGRTSGQRSAEIVAGIRALTFGSAEAYALSTAWGRIIARLLLLLTKDKAIINTPAIRQLFVTELVKRVLKNMPESITIVELASGFGPRGLHLLSRFPMPILLK